MDVCASPDHGDHHNCRQFEGNQANWDLDTHRVQNQGQIVEDFEVGDTHFQLNAIGRQINDTDQNRQSRNNKRNQKQEKLGRKNRNQVVFKCDQQEFTATNRVGDDRNRIETDLEIAGKPKDSGFKGKKGKSMEGKGIHVLGGGETGDTNEGSTPFRRSKDNDTKNGEAGEGEGLVELHPLTEDKSSDKCSQIEFPRLSGSGAGASGAPEQDQSCEQDMTHNCTMADMTVFCSFTESEPSE